MKVFLLTLAILLACCTENSNEANGIDIDISTCMSMASSDWQCLASNGITFAIVEVFDGGGGYNSAIATCVADAWAAGMTMVDVYAFLCPNCGNNPPGPVVAGILANLTSQGVNYGTLWFDVEQCDQCWNDVDSNAQFVQEAVDQAQSQGANIGIYSSEGEWSMTVGNYSNFADLPLWYAHYDDDPSFNDTWAYSFGGWTEPFMKQYNDSGPCVNVDVDWYPG